MEAISKLLGDSAFWFSSIIVAIAVNLFSSYLKDWLDHVRSLVSVKHKKSAQQKGEEIAIVSEFLADNPTLLSVETTIITALENRLLITEVALILPMAFILLQPSVEPYRVNKILLLAALLTGLIITTVQDTKLKRFKEAIVKAHSTLRDRNLKETAIRRGIEQGD